MKYDITKPVRPKMPKLGKGLEAISLLQSQASKTMYEPLAPMYFPSLGAHVAGCEFMYPSGEWKEPCGLIGHICADFSGNKGQVGLLAEAICRDFRTHDEESDKHEKLPECEITPETVPNRDRANTQDDNGTEDDKCPAHGF